MHDTLSPLAHEAYPQTPSSPYVITNLYQPSLNLQAKSYMAPKNVNTKKEAGRAKKAENEAKKKEAVVAEKVYLGILICDAAQSFLCLIHMLATEGGS